MILAHVIIGLMPVENHHFSWFWFLGSVIPDIDHAFVALKNKFFTLGKIIDSISFEDKYDIHYKTKYLHSLLGAVTISVPLLFINFAGALYFFLGYILHLAIDWLDIDEKQYLYPLKIKFKGFLPIFSKTEIIFTMILAVSYIYIILR